MEPFFVTRRRKLLFCGTEEMFGDVKNCRQYVWQQKKFTLELQKNTFAFFNQKPLFAPGDVAVLNGSGEKIIRRAFLERVQNKKLNFFDHPEFLTKKSKPSSFSTVTSSS